MGLLSVTGVVHAEPLGGFPSRAELPVGVATFPVPVPVVAQAQAVSAAPLPQAPAAAAPLTATPAAPLDPADPVPGATTPEPCPRMTPFELGVAALLSMMQDGKGLFAVLGLLDDSSDARRIDDAADRELRRLRLMHRLAMQREAESEREFSENLSKYLRKRAFLEAMEASHKLAPGPFDGSRR